MKPKDMTLGEVLIEFVEAYVEYRFARHGAQCHEGQGPYVLKTHEIMKNFRAELLDQLNYVEIIFKKEN